MIVLERGEWPVKKTTPAAWKASEIEAEIGGPFEMLPLMRGGLRYLFAVLCDRDKLELKDLNRTASAMAGKFILGRSIMFRPDEKVEGLQ